MQDAIDDGDGIIVIFSLDSAQSFNRVKRLVDLVKETKNFQAAAGDSDGIPVALVGNKSDLGGRVVGSRELVTVARRLGCKSFECSARAEQGLREPFHGVMRAIWRAEGTDPIGVSKETRFLEKVRGVDTSVPIWV